MIPKTLFLSYLAICAPRLFPEVSPNEVAVFHEANALHLSSAQPATAVQKHSAGLIVQSGANDVDDTEAISANDMSPKEDFGDDDLVSFSFDALPPGDWDESKLINGTFRLETDGTSRVWSLRDAFPGLPLPPPRGSLRAFGTYPAGAAVRIVFPGGPRNALILTFAFVVNGGFRAGEWRADTYEDGRFVTGASASFGYGWTREQIAFRGEDIRFQVRDAEPSGVLLVGFLEYGRQPEE